jgi:hypothetical protein
MRGKCEFFCFVESSSVTPETARIEELCNTLLLLERL